MGLKKRRKKGGRLTSNNPENLFTDVQRAIALLDLPSTELTIANPP